MNSRTLSAVAVGAAAVLLVAGCATPEADDRPDSDRAAVFALANDPTNLNPGSNVLGNDTAYVVRQLVDSLLYQNPDTGALEPWLAESYEALDEGRAYRFSLRDDVTFSDGSPLTAEAVKTTFDALVAAGADSAGAPLLVGYQSTEVIDETTAEVRFEVPNAAFPSAVATVGLGIVSPATQDVPFTERADGSAVIGSGPFVLESYVPDEATELSRRADYDWAPASLGEAEGDLIERVSFRVVPEASIRAGGLQNGEFDAIGSVLPTDVASIEAAGGLAISRPNPGVVFGLSFNTTRPGPSDPAVRSAVASAIDAEVVRDTAVTDVYAVATSSLGSTTVGWADQSDLLGADPDEAARVLDAAGWTVGDDGVRAKDGARLSLRIPYIQNFTTNLPALEVIQQQLREVGIEVELLGQGLEYIETLASGDFDAFWSNRSFTDGDVLRTTFSSTTTQLHLDDPVLDALLQEQFSVVDEAQRAASQAEAQRYLIEQHYHVPVYALTSIIATGDDLAGFSFGADSRLDTLAVAARSAG